MCTYVLHVSTYIYILEWYSWWVGYITIMSYYIHLGLGHENYVHSSTCIIVWYRNHVYTADLLRYHLTCELKVIKIINIKEKLENWIYIQRSKLWEHILFFFKRIPFMIFSERRIICRCKFSVHVMRLHCISRWKKKEDKKMSNDKLK